ncbi:hypothetical protein BDZ45DRAFT_806711 [Acephala macrosclerotiorum]|nr:hypothetical protein BDZ45DRAFT_806711 [Acephala macrosclerotiorum]
MPPYALAPPHAAFESSGFLEQPCANASKVRLIASWRRENSSIINYQLLRPIPIQLADSKRTILPESFAPIRRSYLRVRKRNMLDDVAFGPYQGRDRDSEVLGKITNHQLLYNPQLFDGSMSRNDLSTTGMPQGAFSVTSSVGNQHQPPNHHPQPLSVDLNYDKNNFTGLDGLKGFNDSSPWASNVEFSASSELFDTSLQAFSSYDVPTTITEAGKMNGNSNPYVASPMSLKRLPPTRHSSGSGMGLGTHRQWSPLRSRVQDKVIKPKKTSSGSSRLREALNHLESAKNALKPYSHFLALVGHLEESILQHMITDTRKDHATAGLSSWDSDSTYQSMNQVSAAEDTESLGTSFDLYFEGHSCGSKADEGH